MSDDFDFELVNDKDKLLKEEPAKAKTSTKPAKKTNKKMGRPKKDEPLRKKQVSTYLSDEEYQLFTEKLGGVPSSIALRNFIVDFIKNH